MNGSGYQGDCPHYESTLSAQYQLQKEVIFRHKLLYAEERRGRGGRERERERERRERERERERRESCLPPFLMTVSLMRGTGVLSSRVASAKSSPVMSSSSTATIRSPGHSRPSRYALPSTNISSMIKPPCNYDKN